MMTHNIRFKAAIWKIALNYPVYPFLSGALALSVNLYYRKNSKYWDINVAE